MHIGQLPVFYNYKQTARQKAYVDVESFPQFPFGFGLSYTTFNASNLRASTLSNPTGSTNFTASDTLVFTASVTNTGSRDGSYVAQIYLLQRVSVITQPVKQLVAFQRVYLGKGEQVEVRMEVEVERYLRILNRGYEWEVERGSYTFAMLGHGGMDATWSGGAGGNVTLVCI